MNLSDKDLDRVFREAADRFEPDDSMLSWNRLEKNLAGQLPERPPGPPRRFGFRPMTWVPAAVLFAGLSFFLIKNQQHYRSLSTLPATPLTKSVSPAPAAGVSPVPATGVSPVLTSDKPVAANQPITQSPATQKPATQAAGARELAMPSNALVPAPERQRAATGSAPKSDENAASVASVENNRPDRTTDVGKGSSGNKGAYAVTATNNRQLHRQKNNSISAIGRISGSNDNEKLGQGLRQKKNTSPVNGTGNVYAGNGSDADGTGTGTPDAGQNHLSGASLTTSTAAGEAGKTKSSAVNTNRPEFAVTRLPSPGHSAPPSVKGDGAGLALQAAGKKDLALPSRALQLRQPLTIGLVMGPDYTDGGVTSNQLGNSVGLTIGYYLSSRLSINTGLLYGVKSYSAQGRDFQPPPPPLRAFGTYPHFESVNGTVTLFEIPLSLRYDFPVDGRTRLFVNAGLSSYLPMKETFTTFFQDQGRIYGLRHINTSPESHWFGIGHFSAGIERDLGKGLSFQVEPYFNLPFTNVCTGNVKLNTYGLLISFRLTPVLSRKKG